MKSKLMQKTFRFVWDEKGIRKAQIIFAVKSYRWEFKECRFTGVNQSNYTLDDWKFLRDLADEVIELCKMQEEGGE